MVLVVLAVVVLVLVVLAMGWWGGYVWVCGWSVVNTLFLPTRRCCGVPCTGPAGVAAVVPLAKIRHANIISHKRRSSIKNDLAP